MKLKVTLTTEDGEVLDQFIVTDDHERSHGNPQESPVALADFLRHRIELQFNTEDLP
jgi:hypothetical protein